MASVDVTGDSTYPSQAWSNTDAFHVYFFDKGFVVGKGSNAVTIFLRRAGTNKENLFSVTRKSSSYETIVEKTGKTQQHINQRFLKEWLESILETDKSTWDWEVQALPESHSETNSRAVLWHALGRVADLVEHKMRERGLIVH